MNTRRIAGVAAGCAVAVATVLGAQPVHDQLGNSHGLGDLQHGVVRAYESTGGAQGPDTLGTHDEARQVYQWWEKVEREGPDGA